MRHLLLLSALSISLSSCYVEVTDHNNHGNSHNTHYPTTNHFETFHLSSNISYNESVRLSGYALQLYTLSNQPHQLAFLSDSSNLLDDSTLVQNLIEGDMLGISKNDINTRLLSNTCDFGYLDISDYQLRSFENFYSNGEWFDEFYGDFSLHTSPSCEYRNFNSNLSDSTFKLEGALNYDIYFKNFISNTNNSLTDEFNTTISGHWGVSNDSIGFWDISNFNSQSNYQKFNDNIVWTQLSSNLTVHDHSRALNGEFKIQTDGFIQTKLGTTHPYSGRITIEDNLTNNIMQLEFYDQSIHVYINGRLLHSHISWDEIITNQSYFDLI